MGTGEPARMLCPPRTTMRRATRYQVRAGLLILLMGCVVAGAMVAVGVADLHAALLLVGATTLVNLLVVVGVVRLWRRPLAELAKRLEQAGQGGRIDADLLARDDDVGEVARHVDANVERIEAAQRRSVELGRQQASIEKFAALGRLSAGVAHEISNPVGGILTCIESMRSLERGSERYEEYLTLVTSGLERIGTIVRQLLSFSRQPAGERRDVDVNDVIREVTILSAFHNREEHVDVIHEEGDLPAVHGFPDLLNQLFLNLVLNGLQAMSEGGTLRIRTQAEGTEVVAILEDTGPGLPEEGLERIFEPFFTTKDIGVGTGLGLSVAMGVVEAHGGSIHAANRPEGGARFTVRLPFQPQASENVAPDEDEG